MRTKIKDDLKIYFDESKTKTKYKLNYGSYIKDKIIGEGNFGKVLRVQKLPSEDQKETKPDSNYFALKISKRFKIKDPDENDLNCENTNKDEYPQELNSVEIREIHILKKLKSSPHKNIVNLFDYKLQDKETWILMEYIPTDLRKFYLSNRNNPKFMNERFFKNIAFQIFCGINHLHSELIIHRDIKLENLFYYEKNNVVKIGDFGLSRILDYDETSKYTLAGTFPYQPPEVLMGLRQYSTPFDIWSIGCILVEICTMRHLFGANDEQGALAKMYYIFGSFNDKVLPGYKNFPNSNLIIKLPERNGIGLVEYIKQNEKFKFENNYFYDLIEKILCIDPTKRITAKECLSHPWFRDEYVK